MIELKQLVEDIKEDARKYNAKEKEGFRMSSMAICGFKYRYELESGIVSEFSTKYMFGIGFETYISGQVKRRDNSYISHFLIGIYGNNKEHILGSTDLCSLKHNHIIEIKTSSSDKYLDIYLRQLKAYMIAYFDTYKRMPTGSIWYYNTYTGDVKEITVSITNNDIEDFNKNVKAFEDNTYYNGIENSLCRLCPNNLCPVNNYKKILTKFIRHDKEPDKKELDGSDLNE